MMLEEQMFRIWAWLLLVLYVLVWTHRVMMRRNSKTYFYSLKETPLMTFSLRILLASSTIGLLLYALNPAWMAWSLLKMPLSMHWFGIALGVVGISILYWSINASGKNFIRPHQEKNDQVLSTPGPYKWVRHPLCSVHLLLIISSFLVTANWFIGLSGILGNLIAILVRTPMEEKIQMEKFGTDYIMYMHRTGRYLPRVESLNTLSPKR